MLAKTEQNIEDMLNKLFSGPGERDGCVARAYIRWEREIGSGAGHYVPEDVRSIPLLAAEYQLRELLVDLGFADSKSKAGQLLAQNAVSISDYQPELSWTKLTAGATYSHTKPTLLRVGKQQMGLLSVQARPQVISEAGVS